MDTFAYDPFDEPEPPGIFDCDEALHCALALAANCHYAVFPVGSSKLPTRPSKEGGKGFHDASQNPDEIQWLWERWPGPLVGIATGAVSNLAVLDIDAPRHPEARAWWRQYHPHLTSRTYRTRSGGLHLYFRPEGELRCSEGKGELHGVDVRANGGYAIHWASAGYECLALDGDFHGRISPWPAWLTKMIWPPPEPVPVRPRSTIVFTGSHDAAGVAGLLRTVRSAAEGQRNGKLNWAAFRMRDLIDRGAISDTLARQELVAAALDAGLPSAEAIRTITSALGAAA